MFGKLLYGSKFHRLPMSRTGSKQPPHNHEINIDTANNKPHPYGAELGMLIKMLQATPHRTLQGCMTTEFARIKVRLAKECLEKAALKPNGRPKSIARDEKDCLRRLTSPS